MQEEITGKYVALIVDGAKMSEQVLEKALKKFLEEMATVGEACAKAFGAEKMNYELLGMGDAHVHWHLFPRKYGDLGEYGNNGNGPVWWYPREKMWCEETAVKGDELEKMKQQLLQELEKLL